VDSKKPHLEHVDALTADMAQDFILIIEVTAEHLCRLVYGMLNLNCDASTSLRFLHDLEINGD